MNFKEELYKFCEENQIKLIGDYDNVKKATPIYFNCSTCNIQIKKSFKCLTKNKDTHVSFWSSQKQSFWMHPSKRNSKNI